METSVASCRSLWPSRDLANLARLL